MFGGLKFVSRAALVAAAVSMGGVAAQAADLGGDCCADLEERVAELEATTARKGNRKVSLKISGTVGSNLIWHDSDAASAGVVTERLTFTDETGEYDSEFRFSGSASVSSDIRIGFVLDFDAEFNGTTDTDDIFVFVESKTLGEVRLGRQDGASDGIHSINLSNAIGQMTDNGADSALGAGAFATRIDFDGHSADAGIKYISPSVAGFIFSAAYLNDDTNTDSELRDRWSVALRYAAEFGAIRIAAGVGYSESLDSASTLDDEFIGSASIMHMPTGLYINGAYGEETNSDQNGWTVQAGIQQNWFGYGATTLYGQYYEGEYDGNLEGSNWGLGVVQNIDAASAQMYLTYDRFECIDSTLCTDDANLVQSGLRIKF